MDYIQQKELVGLLRHFTIDIDWLVHQILSD